MYIIYCRVGKNCNVTFFQNVLALKVVLKSVETSYSLLMLEMSKHVNGKKTKFVLRINEYKYCSSEVELLTRKKKDLQNMALLLKKRQSQHLFTIPTRYVGVAEIGLLLYSTAAGLLTLAIKADIIIKG